MRGIVLLDALFVATLGTLLVGSLFNLAANLSNLNAELRRHPQSREFLCPDDAAARLTSCSRGEEQFFVLLP